MTDEEVREAADLLQDAFVENYRLLALTDLQLAQLFTLSVAAIAVRSNCPPSEIASLINDEGWPTKFKKP